MNTKPFGWLGVVLGLWCTVSGLRAAEVSGTLSGNTTWSDTMSEYVIDSFNGPLVVPAAVTLSVSAGVTIRVKYSNKSALEVRGSMVAQGATLELRTLSCFQSPNRTRGVEVAGEGVVRMSGCTVRAGDRTRPFSGNEGYYTRQGRAFQAGGKGRLELAGCTTAKTSFLPS